MVFDALQSALNRNIAASSAARARCHKLEGQSLQLKLTGLPWPITLSVLNQQVQISRSDAPATATLSGSPVGLLSLAMNSHGASLSGRSVQISGDAEVAQAFSELLKLARPEFEEELSRWVGDVAAHQLGSAARGALQFGRHFLRTLGDNVGEYLREESRDVARRDEVDDFAREVDTLRDDVERLAARLALLEQHKPR